MRVLFTLLVLLFSPLISWAAETKENNAAPRHGVVIGEVISAEDGDPIEYAAIFVGEDGRHGVSSDQNGRFRINVPFGTHTLVATSMGYDDLTQEVTIKDREPVKVVFKMQKSSASIEEVVVVGESHSATVNRTAYNVQSIEIGDMKNTSANITQALSKMSGINIRESGGVGSDTQLSLNGFTGSHVKIFIDGIPQNGNAAFSLNNIPAGFAERIEMYSGVVPIEFGADALGGVVNIITNKANKANRLQIDASYSYGSFNTHKTYLKFGQTMAKSGFSYSVNAYQNYSDNSYKIDNYVIYYDILPTGQVTSSFDANDVVYGLERFHDKYHNETVIASIGFDNTKWTDHFALSLNYSQYYKDIQTGTTQNLVYGEKFSEGNTLTPTLEYSKKDLFTRGLDVRFVSSYDSGFTHNADPATARYNWLGESVNMNLTPSASESKNRTFTTNFIGKYVTANDKHNITLSNTVTSSNRITRSLIDGTSTYGDYNEPQTSTKSVSGLSYLVRPIERLEGTLFAKHFYQIGESFVEDESTGLLSKESVPYSKLGYGSALTYFIVPRHLQAKLSYERAYRLPTTTEMFGDTDMEVGTYDLLPETSDNVNLNLVYTHTFAKKHFVRLDGSLIYRDTHDYIIRSTSGDGSSASYGNYGRVLTKGYSIIARYDYGNLLSVGGTFNNINPRDAEEYVSEGSSQLNFTYGMRIPNQPYKYANADATINFFNIISKHDQISIMYDLFYQEEFTLYWEAIGDSSTKAKVPEQLSHSVTLNYAFQNSRYNISFEARNITDENLYDNYSLQKAGRAFYAKFRVNIFK
ncbi:MAG: TonB-dependent receptor [Rikenellaceae bacterium]